MLCMRHPSPFACLFAALIGLTASPAVAVPSITEFLASNQTGLADEDGARPDWIEIHNPDAAPLDIGGYHLTDDKLNPMDWTFPPGAIVPAGGYLVVFASNKDRAVAGSPLHTDFSLSAGGEYLALTAPGGSPILSEFDPFEVQTTDRSYGVISTSPLTYGFFNTPTPGAANNPSTSPAEVVQFSEPSRTFNPGSPLNVALSVSSPTATIRYTTNRTVPTGASTLYTGTPIPVSTNTRIRARAFEPGRPDGPVRSETYFVIDAAAQSFTSTLPIVLTTTWGGGMSSDVIVNSHIMIFEPKAASGNLARMTNLPDISSPCTLERRGSSTAGDPKYSMAVEFQDEGAFDKNVPVLGMPSDSDWVMHAPYSFDRSMMHNDLIYKISNDAGVYAVRTKFVEHFHDTNLSSPPAIGGAVTVSSALIENITVLTVPDTNVEVTRTQVVSGAQTINDLNVGLNITHPRRGDLKIQLSSPAGTTVDLVLPSSDANTDFDVNLDGQSLLPANDGNADLVASPFYDRVARPAGSLAAFDGQPIAGTWTLRVTDTAAGSAGSVNRFRLQFNSDPTDFFGVYSFQEKITRGDDRVDVENLTTLDNALPAIQGGYMFKVDRTDPGDPPLRPLTGQTFGGIGRMGPGDDVLVWVDPKGASADPTLVVTTAQSNWFRQHLGDLWLSLISPNFMDPVNGYAQYIEVPETIDNFILNVATKNVDGMRLSAYWYKKRFGKVTAGPLWDFDRTQGSTDGRDLNPVTWRGEGGDLGTDFFHYPWYNEMFKDPNFWQLLIDRYHQMRMGALSTANVHAQIDAFAEQLNPGNAASTPAKRSGTRWIGPRGASGSTPGTNGTFPGEIAWLKNWWNSRLNFMDGQFTRPAAASVPSGPVTPGTQVTLTSPSQVTPGVKIYYTTDGTDPRERPTAPPGTGVTIATLLPEISTVRAIVSTSPAGGVAPTVGWRGADLNSNGNNLDDFDDSTWFTNAAGTINGVGYDDNLTVSFLPFLSVRWNTQGPGGTDPLRTAVAPQNSTNTMRTSGSLNGNQSCYMRWPFTLSAADMANLVAPNKLVLQARYDDGFAAWLNGTLTTARPNAPVPGAPPNEYTHASSPTSTHDDTASTIYQDFDITAFMGGLHAGSNVLAIQGLNAGLGSADFLCQPKLVVRTLPPVLSAGAQEYTSPLTITAPTQLFVRTLHPNAPSDPPTQSGGGTGTVPNGSSWSAPTRLYYFPGAVTASQASIQITEVLYHPESPAADELANGWNNSNDFEFVRLTNTGAVPVELTGIYFSNGLEFTAVPGLQNWLPAGQSVVVVENIAAFTYRYGTTFTILGEFKGELDDGGEHIVLNDKTGAVISDFRYEDDGAWPLPADDGYSLLYVSGDQNLPGSWRASLDPGGTSATTYALWLRRYFPNSEIPFQPMSQDDDGDGLNNLGEYVFATDPRNPGSGENAMASSVPGNPPGLAVRRRTGVTDVTWTFETGTGITGWTPSGTPPESVVNNGDGTETVTWRAPALPGPRLFLRVRVNNT